MAKNSILLAAIFLLAAVLRFHRIDAQSFWNDEGNSARIAERSLRLILEGAAGDIHPPGYYLVLAAWRAAAGHTEFALRGLSALSGLLLVALVYRLGRIYFDERAALCAGFFAAFHPALIYYSQEARMYEMAALWGAIAFWAAGDGESSMRGLEKGGWRRGLGFALVLAAGLYTHYSFAFIVIALNLLFIIRLARRVTTTRSGPLRISNLQSLISNLYLPQLAALLLFAPWLPTAIRQVLTWPAGRSDLPVWEAVAGVARWLALGPVSNLWSDAAVLCFTAALAFAGVGWRGRSLPALLWLGVPAGLTLLLGLFSNVFAKFLIVAVPALCLLAGSGLMTASFSARWPPFKMAAAVCLSLIGLALGMGARQISSDPVYARADYRGIVRYLDSIAKPGDAILLNAPNQWEVFTYYHADTSNVFPVARSRPLNVPEQAAELERIAASHDRLFVVYWGDAQSDPGRAVETWLNAHTFKAYDRWYGEVRLAAYAAPRAAAGLQTPIGLRFGDRIVLEGYALDGAAFAPGDILQLTLFWRADSPVSHRYKVFAHLVGDPAAPPAAQHDGEPGGGLALTSTWVPGETVADNHGIFLPLDLPPGEYSLVVGLYGVEDGVRLRHEAGGDSLFLTAILVR